MLRKDILQYYYSLLPKQTTDGVEGSDANAVLVIENAIDTENLHPRTHTQMIIAQTISLRKLLVLQQLLHTCIPLKNTEYAARCWREKNLP